MRIPAIVSRVMAIADLPGDSDDTRLRKRMGVAAGLITVVAPLTVPLQPVAAPPSVTVPLGLGLAVFSAVNLVVLARTKRFERYVIALVGSGPIFVFATNAVAGGVTGSGAASVWTFLSPAYAILALGPSRATPWLAIFLGALAVNVAFDPVIRTWFGPPTYEAQLVEYAQNIGVPLTIIFLLLRYTDLRRRAAEARSDELLTNAIPASIADRLRHGEDRIAEAYPATSVVFCDVVSFTPWANATEPDRVVELLDDLFRRFDAAAALCGVEKIKTVGDAYMAVAGAPIPNPDHAVAAIHFGLAELREFEAWRTAYGLDLQLRVGIASGPVAGGVIGAKRLLFDLWGGTVNTASRMESSGVPGRVQVAASTRALVGDAFGFDERRVEAKGIGKVSAFLVR